MLIIFMIIVLKGWLASNGKFVCLGKNYVKMILLVQYYGFGKSVSLGYKG